MELLFLMRKYSLLLNFKSVIEIATIFIKS